MSRRGFPVRAEAVMFALMTVIYRPPGEQRAYPCRIVEIQGNRAYLAPILRTCVGWMSIERLQVATEEEVSDT
jgi:hypothetical protein